MISTTTRPAALAAAIAAALFLAPAGCGGDDEKPGGRAVPGLSPTIGSTSPANPQPAEGPPGEFGRNVARVTGTSPPDVAGAAVLAAYSPERSKPPNGWVLARRDVWQESVLAAQFAAKPVSAGLMPIARDFLPTATLDLLGRLRGRGFPKGDGLQVLILGEAGQDVFIDLNEQALKVTQLKASSPAKLAAEAVPFSGGWAAKYSPTIVVVSSEARDYALPGAAWVAYSGDSLAFVSRNSVPKPTIELLKQRKALLLEKPTVYLVGPAKVISERVATELRRYATVKRIAGPDPVRTAIAFARYKDRSTGFGWGLKRAPASVSLVNTRDWGNAVGAFNFAAAGPQAPLLLTGAPAPLPTPVKAYLKKLRGAKPNQAFIFGDEASIASATLRELDKALAER